MSDASEAIAALPFVRTKPEGGGWQFWHVTPTGEHDVDFSLGWGEAPLDRMSPFTHRSLEAALFN